MTAATAPTVADAPLIEVSGLQVTFRPPSGPVRAVRNLSIELFPGEILGVVGESGSGKSVTFRALLGLTPQSAQVEGAVTVDGQSGSPAAMADKLRAVSAMVYQNPGAALNPVFTIGFQLSLAAGTKDRAILSDLLRQVGLPDPEAALDAYPHEFSGGMQQRAVIALALAQTPSLLVADEPTTALDVTTEAQILDLLLGLCRDRRLSVAFISHDLGVIGRIADRIVVLKEGETVESGPTEQILTNPQHSYTKMLVASASLKRAADSALSASGRAPMLAIRGLTVDYRRRDARSGRTHRVLNGLELSIHRGETLALVGESGSGKSTLAHAVVGLVPVAAGLIEFEGIELAASSRRQRRHVQRRLQMVFQNPLLSLSPRRTVRWQLHEPLRVHTALDRREREARIIEICERLALDPELLDRRPHQLSGGQAQRVVLGRALLLGPEFIVFDEPTSALDVSIQATVLELLAELKSAFDLTYLFITHDLSVARHLADRVAIMHRGELVELRETEELFTHPEHPYTRTLLDSSSALHT